MKLKRHPNNPIVTASKLHWRDGVTFNPGVEFGPNGEIMMLERAARLRPYQSVFGALKSDDGVHFELIQDTPVWTSVDVGTPYGDVEDPRTTKIGDTYYMTFVHYKSHWNLTPHSAVTSAIYEAIPCEYPMDIAFQARTGICKSKDMLNWEFVSWTGPEGWDDKDCVFFPEKIDGKYWMFSRPCRQIGGDYGCDAPSIWLRTSDDMVTWSEAKLHSQPEVDWWQGQKIGASAPPLKTDKGWLLSFHGVKNHEYRVGFMLLDLEDPFKILARTADPVLEPEYYYEKVGFIIPNCVFPSGSVIIDGVLHLYYGACDSCICLATAEVDELLDHLLNNCSV
jgi:predicted GH43/DUF377 family glycosyl hydrolase